IHGAYFFTHPQTEPLRYRQWATAILDAAAPPRPPFDEAPGYPYFVAAVYSLCGRSMTVVALAQCVLDALTCVLIAVCGSRWFDLRTGTVAGALAVVYGPLIYFSGELLPVTLLICLATAALAVVATTVRR